MPDIQPPAREGSTLPVFNWFDICASGANFYVDACRGWGDLLAASTSAQAKAFAEVCAIGAQGVNPGRFWPSEKEVLLVVEGQAERFAEAVRETMHDLQGAEGRTAPLPD